MSEITGGCLCGKIRYRATAAPAMQAVCHCRDCQRQTGTSFSVVAAFQPGDVTITGDLKTYTCTGGSGKEVVRRFCGDCGSPIVSEPAASPGMLFFKAGTFDDPSGLAPTVHIWCDTRHDWLPLPEGAMTFARSPGS